MPKVKGYAFKDELLRTDTVSVYRSEKISDKQLVIVKLLNEAYPTQESIEQLDREYNIAGNLDMPGVVKPYSLDPVGRGKILVLEDFEALPLSTFLDSKPLEIRLFLELAIRMAGLLSQVHRNNIIHCNLTPSSFWINPQSREIKIDNF